MKMRIKDNAIKNKKGKLRKQYFFSFFELSFSMLRDTYVLLRGIHVQIDKTFELKMEEKQSN
jgi:hypothetical protein